MCYRRAGGLAVVIAELSAMKKRVYFSALMFFLVGCGASDEGPKNEPSASAESISAAQAPDSQAIEKVDEIFRMTPAMHDAVEKEIARCLDAQGLRWEARPYQARSVRSLASPTELSLEDARVRGYDARTNPEEAGGLPPGKDQRANAAFAGDPEKGTVSVEGIPGGVAKEGCLATAYEKVFGAVESGVLFEGGAENLPLPYVNAALDGDSMRKLNDEWSGCMKRDEMLDYATPDLIHQPTKKPDIATAVADAKCREKIDYESRLRTQLNAYLTTFLNEKQGLIVQASDAKKAAESKVSEILGQ